MAEGSLSVSVPAWRLRTDTDIGGGISKLNGANLRNGRMRRCAVLCLRCLLSDLKQIHGICKCACAGTRNSVGGRAQRENDKGLGGEVHGYTVACSIT